jgi:feruloyl esterase
VWHGSADTVVVPANAAETVKQWANVHGLPATAAVESRGPGFTRQVWRDKAGREVIESFTIAGMAHGAPLAAGAGEGRYGNAGPFLLDVGVSSTFHIANFWGLAGARTAATAEVAIAAPDGAITLPSKVKGPKAEEPAPKIEPAAKAVPDPGPAPYHNRDEDRPSGLGGEIHAVITKALRAAGLMKP